MSLSRPTISTLRRRTSLNTLSGFGALVERETVLLWLLNSRVPDARTTDQSKTVAGIIASLQQQVESLPVPGRFDFLKRAVHRAETRATPAPAELRPTRRDLIGRHRALETDLNALKAQRIEDRRWAVALTQAAAAHAQMAYALFVEERQKTS